MPLSRGTRLGPYEIVSPLGAGGMGEIYRAADPRLGREVALKVLPAELYRDDTVRARFEQEARAASALNHPNIVSVYDIGEDNGVRFIVTELVEGESLRQAISHGSMPPRRLMEIAQQIADGLAAAHAAGVVHRDLKPENVLITRDGRVKIIDFGLAKQLFSGGSTGLTAQTLTMPGAVMGTIGYMSPEQIRAQNVDQRTDIFSLGIILYEMAAGKSAFSGSSAPDVMSSILREDPPQLAGADLPPGLPFIVDRCLKKDPTNRFQTATDLAFAIRNLSGTAIQAQPAPAAKPKSSFRSMAWAAAVLFFALAGAYKALRPTSARRPIPTPTKIETPAANADVAPPPKSIAPPTAPQAPPEKKAKVDQPQKAALPTPAEPTPATIPPPAAPDSQDTVAPPNSPLANAQQLLRERKWAEAQEAFTNLIKTAPNNSAAYLGRGRALVQAGDLDRALEDYNKAIQLRPGLAMAYVDRGHLYNRQRDYRLALKDFDEAVRLNPQLPNAYEGRSLTRAILRDHRGAQEDRRQALELRRNRKR